jgi:hypothetical protein
MDELPEIPFLWIDATLIGFVALALLAIHLWRVLRSEFRRRRCIFCGESIPSEDYADHVAIHGLKALLERTQPPREPEAGVLIVTRSETRETISDPGCIDSSRTQTKTQ